MNKEMRQVCNETLAATTMVYENPKEILDSLFPAVPTPPPVFAIPAIPVV